MLTIRSRVRPTGAWLVARLYRQKQTARLTFSIRLMAGGRLKQVANGIVSDRFDTLVGQVNRRAVELEQFEAGLLRIGRERGFAEPLYDAALAAAHALDALEGDYHDAPVPVFATTDFTLSVEAWAALLYSSISSHAGLNRPIEVIPAPIRRPPARSLSPRMVLPMDIHMPHWLAGPLAQKTWFLSDSSVSEYGLRLRPTDSPLPEGTRGDVVVGDAQGVSRAEAERWLGDRRSSARLRVLVNVNFEPLWGPRLVQGTAAMLLPAGGWGNLSDTSVLRLHELFEALSHDRPLHYALRMTRSQEEMRPGLASWFHGPRLYADDDVDQWFRLSNALPQAVEAATEAYALGVGASLGPFRERLRGYVPTSRQLDDVFDRLNEVHRATDPLRAALKEGVHFTYESSGLQPMSRMLAAKAGYDTSHRHLVESLQALRLQPGAIDALEEVQERRVDASLAVVNSYGPPVPVGRTEGVPSGSALQLSVSIGQRSEESLVVGEPPSLDPLLPELDDDESHDIDIVVFEKDFVLAPEQKRAQTVRLGRFGGTAPVSWLLRAPVTRALGQTHAAGEPEWKEGDVAELRFSVYFRNQLLQSFDLRATLAAAQRWQPAGTTEIKCDFSQTRRFGSLDTLGHRFINISLNEDEDGRHTLAVKGNGFEPAAVTWDSGLLSTLVDVLRDAVFNGMVRNGAPVFLFDSVKQGLEPLPAGTFESVVQEMAVAGAALRNQLYLLNSEPLQEALTQAKHGRGEVIQVALLRPNYTLPWGLLYDFKLPDIKKGTAAEICRGRDKSGVDCGCVPGDGKKICLRGFWGFRHIVEQLAGTRDPERDAGGIGPSRTKPVMGFIRTLSDAYTNALSALFKAEGEQIEEYEKPQSFVELLENETTRPALVMYVGHQDVDGPAKAPTPKLLTHDNNALLRLDDVVERLEDKKTWKVPRSLVLLLGCATGVARVDTGIGLAGALLQLGAVGVVGTECTVYSDLVARVARDLRQALFAGKPIGEALHEVNWQLADEGCPMGLAFTYLGPIKAGLPT